MTVSRSQLAKWATATCRLSSPANERETRDYQLSALVLQNPGTADFLSGARLSKLVWNLGYLLAWISDRSGPRRLQYAVDIAAATPAAFEHWFGRTQTQVDGLYMYWDLARRFEDDRPRVLHDAMFDALAAQLQSGNAWIQQSALHGFGHLKDPRCVPLIEDFVSRCAPGDLRDYAEAAARFEVL